MAHPSWGEEWRDREKETEGEESLNKQGPQSGWRKKVVSVTLNRTSNPFQGDIKADESRPGFCREHLLLTKEIQMG